MRVSATWRLCDRALNRWATFSDASGWPDLAFCPLIFLPFIARFGLLCSALAAGDGRSVYSALAYFEDHRAALEQAAIRERDAIEKFRQDQPQMLTDRSS